MDASHQYPRLTWYQGSDGQPLAVRVWQPDDTPRASVVLLHGILSHGGWYVRSCGQLARAGCEVHFLDRRGSGLNLGPRGDIDHWETWPRDVEVYLESLPPDRPRVLGGISWGGKLAAAVARRRPELVDGLALICPGIYAYQQPTAVQALALRLARIPLVACRYVPVPVDDPALFTDAEIHRLFVARDPLALRKVTLRFAVADQQLTCFAREAPAALNMPTLLVLAGRDRIVDNARMRTYLEAIAATDKRVIEYAAAGHTLDFDPVASRYVDDLGQWMWHLSS